MTPAAGLLVLGIDAANPDLLLRWAADGSLPNLQRVLQRGTWGRLKGIEGCFIGATWPSLVTSRSPAGHGVHYLLQLIPGTYRYHRPHEGEYLRADPFWLGLSALGKRVAVLDVPLSRLDTRLNGIQVVEWGGHDSLFGFGTSPAPLRDEILQRYGAHPQPSSCDAERRTAADYQCFVSGLERGAELKGRLTRELLGRERWDCLIQVFTEAHCCGHQCWHLHDQSHPAFDAELARALGDPLRRVYRAIDAAIGGVLEAAGETPVLLFTAHGMEHWYGAQFLLPEILQKLDVWHPRAAGRPTPGPSLVRRVWRTLPAALRKPLAPLRNALAPSQPGPSLEVDLDPARSRCFPVGNGLAVGGIRLNLQGREPQGILTPGAETGSFVAELSAALLEIVDERTGGPLVRRVLRTAELYQGPWLDWLPDLLVEWNDAVPTGSTQVGDGPAARVRATSPRIGMVEGSNSYGRTGEHRPGGLFVAAGPGIQRGQLAREVSLLDLAPTIGVLLGVSLPGCEGAPIREIVA